MAGKLFQRILCQIARVRARAVDRGIARAERMLQARDPCERVSHQMHFLMLLRSLSPAQRAEFARYRRFTVRGSSGRTYRICYGTIANIYVADEDGSEAHRLCAAPARLSAPAVMLAQKLMLETQEREFLELAIKHPPLPRAGFADMTLF